MSNSTEKIVDEEIDLLSDAESDIMQIAEENEYYIIEPTALRVHHLYVNIYLIYTNIIVNGKLHSEYCIMNIFSFF